MYGYLLNTARLPLEQLRVPAAIACGIRSAALHLDEVHPAMNGRWPQVTTLYCRIQADASLDTTGLCHTLLHAGTYARLGGSGQSQHTVDEPTPHHSPCGAMPVPLAHAMLMLTKVRRCPSIPAPPASRRFGRSLPCNYTDPLRDFDPDECLPYVLPLTTAREVCSEAHDFEYEGARMLE